MNEYDRMRKLVTGERQPYKRLLALRIRLTSTAKDPFTHYLRGYKKGLVHHQDSSLT